MKTDKEFAERIIKDPKFCVESFFWLIDKNRQKIPFHFNPAQARFYENWSQYDLILKSRKEGFSTLIEALFLHACLFGRNANAVTMAHTWDDTVVHLDRVKFFIDNLGGDSSKIKVKLDKENQRELYFPDSNSHYWIGTAGSRQFGRGRDVTHLHLSEAAHYPDRAIIAAVMEACVPKAWRVMETTANGVDDVFFPLWREAGDPAAGSKWKQHFYPWFEDPTNQVESPNMSTFRPNSEEDRMMRAYKLSAAQILWYRGKRAEMADKTLMPQEYPSTAEEAFLHSGRPCFNREKISVKRALAMSSPVQTGNIGDVQDDGHSVRFMQNPEGFLRMWKTPRNGRKYLISADVSEGVIGGDWSVAQIFDRASWEQIATFRCRMDPGAWGRKLVQLGYYFNNAVLVPEINNHGWATIEAIKTERYPHLLNTREIWGEQETPRDGFPTDEKRRSMILSAIRNAVDDDTVYFNDPVTLGEMDSFIQNESTGKFEAQKGCFDDCVMSAAIGVYCLKFMTVDESYNPRARAQDAVMRVTSIVGEQGRTNHRSRTGYR